MVRLIGAWPGRERRNRFGISRAEARVHPAAATEAEGFVSQGSSMTVWYVS